MKIYYALLKQTHNGKLKTGIDEDDYGFFLSEKEVKDNHIKNKVKFYKKRQDENLLEENLKFITKETSKWMDLLDLHEDKTYYYELIGILSNDINMENL